MTPRQWQAFPFKRLYTETPRHPDTVRILNEIGEYMTVRMTCRGKHTRNRTCQYCEGRE